MLSIWPLFWGDAPFWNGCLALPAAWRPAPSGVGDGSGAVSGQMGRPEASRVRTQRTFILINPKAQVLVSSWEYGREKPDARH